VIVLFCVLVQLASTAVGVAIGTLLHRPVVRHTGITLLVSIGAFVGLVLLPPVQHALRTLNDDHTDGVLVMCVIALLIGVGAVALSGVLADRAR
jgi:Kef-type K+ transport system membrane component KefB